MPRTALERAALLCLLLSALTLLALLLVNASRAEGATVHVTLRQVQHQAERYYRLPHGVLRRLARLESTHRDMAPRKDGPGCAVGRYQLQVPSCDPVAMSHLQGAPVNTWAAAAWLAWSRAWCAARPGKCICPWSRWNYRAQGRLCAALAVPES